MTRSTLLAAIALTCATAGAAQADRPAARGITLAAASNFSQGLHPGFAELAANVPVRRFRDGMSWAHVEAEPGHYGFSAPRTRYPDVLAERGHSLTVTVNWGNPLYDAGVTPHTAGAIAAHARYAAALVNRFPAIEAIEVHNEFNGNNFVTGPVRAASVEERARYHVAILEAVHDAVRAVDPHVKVLGGAAHSIPAGYLWDVFDKGGGDAMDAVVLHPYTTPAEQLAPQLAVLRWHEAAARLPIHVTEFGNKDPAEADDTLVKMLAAMAAAGVERAVWYPLNARGDGMIPLIRADGTLTAAGRAYRFADRVLTGRPARDVSPDPFTYAFRFGADTLVLWGEPRGLTLKRDDISPVDAQGERRPAQGLAIAMDRPLVLIAEEPMALGRDVVLEDHGIVADSYHQFAFPRPGEAFAPDDGFERVARLGERERPLATRPGQERGGTVWTPYLGGDGLFPARVTPTELLPAGDGANPVAIVHRYVAPEDQAIVADAIFAPAARSQDGVVVEVTLNGEVLAREVVTARSVIGLPGLDLSAGDRLAFTVGPNGTMRGDVTDYRITLRKAR